MVMVNYTPHFAPGVPYRAAVRQDPLTGGLCRGAGDARVSLEWPYQVKEATV